MSGPDKFDPLMDLNTAKNVGDHAAPPIPESTPGNSVTQRFDGSANFGTDGHDIVIGNPNIAGVSGDPQRQPADVNRFDGSGGLSGAPERTKNYERDDI